MREIGKRILQVLEALDSAPADLRTMKQRLPDMDPKHVRIYLERAVTQGYATKIEKQYKTKSYWRELSSMSYEDRQKLKPRKMSLTSVWWS